MSLTACCVLINWKAFPHLLGFSRKLVPVRFCIFIKHSAGHGAVQKLAFSFANFNKPVPLHLAVNSLGSEDTPTGHLRCKLAKQAERFQGLGPALFGAGGKVCQRDSAHFRLVGNEVSSPGSVCKNGSVL